MRRPFNGNYPVTQGFGANPGVYGPGGHRGIDYGLPRATPVIAVTAGYVNRPPFQTGGFGTYITLTFGEFICYYGHLLSVARVGAVNEGDVIGYSNSSGWSTGNHLHFEVYRNRTLINPDSLFANPPAPTVKTVTVTLSSLQVRTGPGTNYAGNKANTTDGMLHAGMVVQVAGQVAGQNVTIGGKTTNIWYKSVRGNYFWSGGTR